MKLKKDKPLGVISEDEIFEMAQGIAMAEPAYLVGKRLIASLCEATGFGEAEAAALLMDGGGMPTGLAAVSARAANDLMRISAEEGLEGDFESYLADERFAKMLLEMPVKAALRLYKAECCAEENAKAQRELGAKDIMEKIAARRALPSPIKGNSPAQPDTDYANMPSDQFYALKERLMHAAADGRHVKL